MTTSRPPKVDRYGYGFRVPALLVSPYAKRGAIDHDTLDSTSILRFIEDNWQLAPLARRDANANSIATAFDFSHPPRAPAFIPAIRASPAVATAHTRVVFWAYGGAALLALALTAAAPAASRRRPATRGGRATGPSPGARGRSGRSTRHGNHGSACPGSPMQRGTPSSSTGTWDPARARSARSRAALRLEPRRRAAATRGCASGRSTGAGSSAAGPTTRTRHSRGPGEEATRPCLVPLLLVLGGPPAACAARDSAPVVSVRTVPAVSGITITFDGRRYVTDADGTRARLPRPRRQSPPPTCGLGSPCTSGDSMRARSCDSHAGSRSERTPSRRWTPSGASAGSSSTRVARPVPTGRVERLVLRSTTGEVRVVRSELGRPRWLFSRRVSLIRGKPVLKDVGYAVQRISVLGSNVVNSGQQTFLPEHQRTVRFKLAFFTLTIRGEDALFGSSVGTPRAAPAAERQHARAASSSTGGRWRRRCREGTIEISLTRRRLRTGPAAPAVALAGGRRTGRDVARSPGGRRGPARRSRSASCSSAVRTWRDAPPPASSGGAARRRGRWGRHEAAARRRRALRGELRTRSRPRGPGVRTRGGESDAAVRLLLHLVHALVVEPRQERRPAARALLERRRARDAAARALGQGVRHQRLSRELEVDTGARRPPRPAHQGGGRRALPSRDRLRGPRLPSQAAPDRDGAARSRALRCDVCD